MLLKGVSRGLVGPDVVSVVSYMSPLWASTFGFQGYLKEIEVLSVQFMDY